MGAELKSTITGKTDILQVFSQRVIVEGELIAGKGEDSYLYMANEEVIAAGVFDGCGGSGARRYAVFENRTGAYLGSRIVCGVVQDWFDQYGDSISEELWISHLKAEIQGALKEYAAAGGKSAIRGSMVRDLPTTAAITVCRYKQEKLLAKYIWAGDSRGYLLNGKGLHQITTDDLEGEDAMSNLTNDGVLKNVISASANFELHSKDLVLDMPCIVINATDGCFNYLLSPMHFEFLLLDSLLNADNIVAWEKNLDQNMRIVSGDDHDLTMLIFGYEEFETLRCDFENRLDYLRKTYVDPWESISQEEHQKLWIKYRGEQAQI